ncbi:MAG: acyl-CoA dehydrogenase family protein [Solirubrobacterales bacterium]|nr:acyl-CoA dehydrogenase family protein [Solirubrobacterales bacterium]
MSSTAAHAPARLDPHDPLAIEASLSEAELRTRDRVRGFVDERVRPQIAELFAQGRWPLELVPELGRLGVLGMHLEGYGCAGASAVEYGLACAELEACDSGLRTFVSVQGSLAMTAIHAWGSEDQRREWLPRLAGGEAIACFALTEPEAGSDPASMRTQARREGEDWLLDGRKRWIGMGSVADVAVVWARTEAGIRGFLVPRGTPGFRAEDITDKLALRASIQSELRFESCRVPGDAMLPKAEGLRGPFTCLEEARYGIVWGVTGAARDCYETALVHAMRREQFGQPIGSYQLVQERLVDMAVGVARAQLLALQLGRMKDGGRLAPEHVSIGKLDNVRVAQSVARTARSLLGGDGVTLAHPVMRHMANLEAVATYEGTAEIHTLIVGGALTGQRSFA